MCSLTPVSSKELRVIDPLSSLPPLQPGMVARDGAWLAHNQNNFIQVALVRVSMLKDQLDTDPILLNQIHDLELILEDMERVNKAALMAFHATRANWVDPQSVILKTVEQVRLLDNKRTKLEIIRLPEKCNIPIHPSHLQQVVFNILKNAIEAVPSENGRIIVSSQINGRESGNQVDFRNNSKKLLINIEDNGPGIDPIVSSYPDALYTTKQNGNGLGMAHARQLLNLYGGKIFFERNQDKLTTKINIEWPY